MKINQLLLAYFGQMNDLKENLATLINYHKLRPDIESYFAQFFASGSASNKSC